jgi:LPS export ABC transporter protein LptC
MITRLNKPWILALIPAIIIAWLLTERLGVAPEPANVAGSMSPDSNYDGFGRGIRSIIYDINGAIAYTLTASEQRFFPGQITELQTPMLQMYEADSERWNISAASGRILASSNGSIQQLDLTDAVQLLHRPSPGNSVRLTTDWLIIEPPAQTMHTDARVRVSGIGIEQTAQGMQADMGLSTLTFLSDIQGRYHRAIE